MVTRPGSSPIDIAFVADFRLSITQALADQLSASLAMLQPAPLTIVELSHIAPRGGVYQLFHNENLVYIGKADSNLAERLKQHHRKISGRENITVTEITFTALYVDEDLSAVAPETLLINKHKVAGSLAWNFNGFGNKDPGKERDTSAVEHDHFDYLYPANLEYHCQGISEGTYSVGELLALLKKELPYIFRYEGGNRAKSKQPSEYGERIVHVDQNAPSAKQLFQLVAEVMPDWQITVLPGYVIMYREKRSFPSQRAVITGVK